MKKYVLFLLTLPALLAACDNSTELDNTVEAPKDNFTISGTIADAEGMVLYLETGSENGVISVDKTTIEAGGQFKMEGNIPGMGIYQLRLGEVQENALPITLAPNDRVTIQSSLTSYLMDPRISGVEWGNAYGEYMKMLNDFSQKQQELAMLRGSISQDELMARYAKMKQPIDDFSRDFILKNPGSSFNIILSSSLMPMNGFNDYPEENVLALTKMSEAYNKSYPDSPITEKLAEQVVQIASGYEEYQLMKSGKKVAPEIALPTPEGKEIRLSSLKGKVVLIDFWASWCAPCRQENPNVVRLYKKYKDKGFTVFSVSLDTEAENWKAAIAADGLIWPNHVSDLKGWQTPVQSMYKFNGIPYTVLVDRQGNIIDVGLRGPALEQKLEEVL